MNSHLSVCSSATEALLLQYQCSKGNATSKIENVSRCRVILSSEGKVLFSHLELQEFTA